MATWEVLIYDVLDSFPAYNRVYNEIGLCYYYLGDYEVALKNYEKGFDLKMMDEVTYLSNTSLALSKSGKLEEAKLRIQRMEKLTPDDGWVYRNWALYYSLKKDIDQAITNLEKAVRLGYNNLDWIQSEDSLEILRTEQRYLDLIDQMKVKKE